MGDHPAPPKVLGPLRIGALPEHQCHERRADFLSGPQHQVREFLAGNNPQTAVGVAGKRGGPLARPAHGQDQPAAGHRQIVIREGVIGAPPTLRRQPQLGLGRQDLLERLIKIRCARVPFVVLEQVFPFRAPLDPGVDRLDVGEHGGLRLAGVLEIHRPFHDGEGGIGHGQATDLQAGLGIGPRQGVLRAALGQLAALALPRPGRQKPGGGLLAVEEREHRVVGLTGGSRATGPRATDLFSEFPQVGKARPLD